jgi:hypothetical protein
MEFPGLLELMMSVYCPKSVVPAPNRARVKQQRFMYNLRFGVYTKLLRCIFELNLGKQTENMETFLYIVLGFYLLGWLCKRVLPWLLVFVVQRWAKKQMGSPSNFEFGTPAPQPAPAKKASKTADVVGEYIDFEEIE